MKKLVLGIIFSLIFATTVYAAGFKTVDGRKVLYNDNGELAVGWITEDYRDSGASDAWKSAVYYAEADGTVAVKKWLQIPVQDGAETKNYWFYFGDGGRKVYNNGDGEYKDVKIGDASYAFANDGHMVTGWAKVKDDDDNISGWRYYRADGSRQPKGWFMVPSVANPQGAWYYADDNGKVAANALKEIGKVKYLFDDNGEMVTGLVAVAFESGARVSGIEHIRTLNELEGAKGSGDDETRTGIYCFADDGSMQIGGLTVVIEDTEVQCYFNTSGNKAGKGFTGIHNNRNYIDGILTGADKDIGLEIIELKNGKQGLLNYAGVVFTSGIHSDGNGTKYRIKNGVVEVVD
ncbi:MAG: hypothetical protein Q4E54_04875 [Lachnospiraceae bacterium]|nr:hypothetical protein [Lachnospiraceae bacterium]